MALPCGTTGSLSPTFVPARLVGLAALPLPSYLPDHLSGILLTYVMGNLISR